MALVLPTDGQFDWGDELNAAVIQADTDGLTAQTLINNHAANSPADPHGDRAYTQSLINPIITGTNLPNGFVILPASGIILQTLLPTSIPLSTTATVSNTLSETIFAQFAIPSGDWTAGTYSYDFRIAGQINWATAPSLTIKWRMGA